MLDVPRPAWRALGLAIPLLLQLVFAGRHAVGAFYPRGEVRPDMSAASTTRIRGPSGAELAVTRYRPAAGPTLVLTHGWGADQRDWAWIIRDRPKQFQVVAWDRPGLGATRYAQAIAGFAAAK